MTKRSMFVLAVAGTFACPLRIAAMPSVYGQAHVSVEWVDEDAEDEWAVSNNNSLIGIKGEQDLGEGLAAVYQVEWGVDLADNDDDDDLGFQRERFVGLSSADWGTLLYGRHDFPLKRLGREVDLFWHSQMGQNRSITAVGSGTGPGFDLMVSNVIAYRSPRIAGVEVLAVYSTDHDLVSSHRGGDDDSQNAYGVSIAYRDTEHSNGPWFAGVGFESHAIAEAVERNIDREKAVRAVATLDHHGFRFTGFGQYSFDEGFLRGNDRLSYGVGMAFTELENTYKAQWYRAQTSRKIAENGGWMIAGGVDHAFTDAVTTYVIVAYLRPDANALSNQAGFEFDTGLDLGAQGHFEAHPLVLDNAGRAERQLGVSLGMRILF